LIVSFRCKETQSIWQGEASRKLARDMQNRALVKLRQLDAARTLDDLALPPSNKIKALKGDRKGQMSIRINDQWRICFKWKDGEAHEVEIVDYH
jgi:proteic killer suppression protein